MKLTVFDVNHGLSVWLQTPSGRNVLFDLGSGARNEGEMESPCKWLQKNGYSFDALVITHPHDDHISDIENLEGYPPKVLYRPGHLSEEAVREGNPSDSRYVKKYLDLNARYTAPVTAEESPFSAAVNGGVNFSFFTPTTNSVSNLNNHSVVTVIEYCGVKILLPGDNEPPSWNELLENPSFKSAIGNTHILIAPHHGRESGFSDELFGHINPLLTIISDGEATDTNASSRYSMMSRGWDVGGKVRKCLTTRSDGQIKIIVAPPSTGTGIGSLGVATGK